MKKHLLFISLCIALVLAGKAQTAIYHPMATSNVIWGELFYQSGSGSTTFQFSIFGDTLIGTNTYHKLYKRTSNCRDTVITKNNASLIGGIREDNFKRVYFYAFNTSISCTANATYKLYDFSKTTPGDTIHFDSPASGSCKAYSLLTLQSIDSILINNKYRKYFHFNNGENWIEGIGSMRGLLSALTPFPTCTCTFANVCYRENYKIVYMNPVYNYCFCYTSVGINDIKTLDKTAFFPNPFSSETTLKLNRPLVNATLAVFDAYGRLVKEMKNLNGENIVFNREDLARGIYFTRLIEGNTVLATGKFIIIDN